jgi:hypothetical protein
LTGSDHSAASLREHALGFLSGGKIPRRENLSVALMGSPSLVEAALTPALSRREREQDGRIVPSLAQVVLPFGASVREKSTLGQNGVPSEVPGF